MFVSAYGVTVCQWAWLASPLSSQGQCQTSIWDYEAKITRDTSASFILHQKPDEKLLWMSVAECLSNNFNPQHTCVFRAYLFTFLHHKKSCCFGCNTWITLIMKKMSDSYYFETRSKFKKKWLFKYVIQVRSFLNIYEHLYLIHSNPQSYDWVMRRSSVTFVVNCVSQWQVQVCTSK